MSNFEEDASASYLRKVKTNHFTFYARMENKPAPKPSASNNNNNKNPNSFGQKKSIVQETMNVLFNNSAAPSLPRNYLPSQEFTSRVAANFDQLRNQLLEIRMEISKCTEAAEQNDNDDDGSDDDDAVNQNQNQRRRRNRNVAEEDNRNSGSSSTKRISIVALTARRIFASKQGQDLFETCFPKNFNEHARWNQLIFHSRLAPLEYGHDEIESFLINKKTRVDDNSSGDAPSSSSSSSTTTTLSYKSSYLTLQPKVTVSLLTRLSAGVSNYLVETICRKFASIATGGTNHNLKIDIDDQSNSPRITFDLSVTVSEKFIIEQQSIVASSASSSTLSPSLKPTSTSTNNNTSSSLSTEQQKQQQQRVQLESLTRSVTLLRHTQIGCWLYCALCAIELPLSIEVSRSLQQILRICCKTLKSLFDLRPDIRDVVVDDGSAFDDVINNRVMKQTNDSETAKIVLSRINETADNQTENEESLSSTTTRDHINIVVNSIDFFTVEDARALMTLIIVIGKSFKQANPALLPL